jgi:hypothetical protein
VDQPAERGASSSIGTSAIMAKDGFSADSPSAVVFGTRELLLVERQRPSSW